MRPFGIPRRFSIRHSKMFRFSGVYLVKNLQVFEL